MCWWAPNSSQRFHVICNTLFKENKQLGSLGKEGHTGIRSGRKTTCQRPVRAPTHTLYMKQHYICEQCFAHRLSVDYCVLVDSVFSFIVLFTANVRKGAGAKGVIARRGPCLLYGSAARYTNNKNKNAKGENAEMGSKPI